MKEFWIVKIGRLYCCGLGQTFDGYQINGEPVAGIVVSKLRKFAHEFSSYDDARRYADLVGGIVCKEQVGMA